MKVVLLKDVRGVGRSFEIKDVSDGYAKNFLLPKGLAKTATQSAIRETEEKKKSEGKLIEGLRLKLAEILKATESEPLSLKVKVGEHNEIFGGIHELDIENVLKGRGYNNLQIAKLEKPIKSVGVHKVKIKLGKGVEGEIDVEVKPL